jgi:hypothetical protein
MGYFDDDGPHRDDYIFWGLMAAVGFIFICYVAVVLWRLSW